MVVPGTPSFLSVGNVNVDLTVISAVFGGTRTGETLSEASGCFSASTLVDVSLWSHRGYLQSRPCARRMKGGVSVLIPAVTRTSTVCSCLPNRTSRLCCSLPKHDTDPLPWL